jgi:hypothetical protein
MELIDRHFDRVGRKQTLNSAIIWTVCASITIGLGICMLIKYFQNGDNAGLLLGVAFAALGIFNTLTGTQMIRAVVRRITPDSQKRP